MQTTLESFNNYVIANQMMASIYFACGWLLWGFIMFFVYHLWNNFQEWQSKSFGYLTLEFFVFGGMGPISTATLVQ
jgi:hypothetical protein